uniref:Cadherin N-terminal domain-containing protein n=1 Tax=Sinocyclocheilus grahami TaxID=75366 RepID=A0A672M300_SINGR
MIINQLTFLLLFCLLGWSDALIRPVPGISMSDRDGRTLQRTKRGWMWNSFFLLEEWTGTGKQYVGKVRAVTVCVFFFRITWLASCSTSELLCSII